MKPVLAGCGPTLFAGLSERLELKLVGRQEFRSWAVALRSRPVDSPCEGRAAPRHAGRSRGQRPARPSSPGSGAIEAFDQLERDALRACEELQVSAYEVHRLVDRLEALSCKSGGDGGEVVDT